MAGSTTSGQQQFDTTGAMEKQLQSLQQQVADTQAAASYSGSDTNKQIAAAEAAKTLPAIEQRYETMLNSYAMLAGQRASNTNVSAPTSEPYIYTKDQNGNLIATPSQNYNPATNASSAIDIAIKQQDAASQALNDQLKAKQISTDEWYKQQTLLQQQFSQNLEAQLNGIRATDSLNTANGQALGAETSRFDRIFTTAGDIADAAVRGPLLPAIISATAPAGDLQDLANIESKMASGDFSPTQFGSYHYQLPFDPRTIGTEIATSALNQLSPIATQLNQTGAFQPAPTGYQVPKTPGQVLSQGGNPGTSPTPKDPGVATASTPSYATPYQVPPGGAAGTPGYIPQSTNIYDPNAVRGGVNYGDTTPSQVQTGSYTPGQGTPVNPYRR